MAITDLIGDQIMSVYYITSGICLYTKLQCEPEKKRATLFFY